MSVAEEFLQLVYSGVRDDLDARIAYFSLPSRKTYFGSIVDAESFIASNRSENVYFAVGLMRSDISGGRGKESDVVAIPGFWADLDDVDEDRMLDILSRCPEPTIIVATGGGYHAYWLFEDGAWELSSSSDRAQAKTASKAFVTRLQREAGNGPGKVDIITADIARVLRLPGSRNQKPERARDGIAPLVAIYDDEGPGHVRADLLAWAGANITTAVSVLPSAPPIQKTAAVITSVPIDVVDLKRRLRARKYDQLRTYLDGAALPSDGRNTTLVSTLQTIANYLPAPETTSAEVLAALLTACLAATETANSQPGKLPPTMDQAVTMADSALAKAVASRASNKVDPAWAQWLSGGTVERPRIVVGPDVAVVADEAESALRSLGQREPTHAVYTRGEVLVSVVRGDALSDDGVKHAPEAPRIRVLPTSALIETLSRSASFAIQRSTQKETYTVEDWPPRELAQIIEARGRWKLPRLDALTETPLLLADGRILETTGYDKASAVLYMPSIKFPSVPVAPTTADVEWALAALLDPVCDFPFVADHDKSAWLALILTILARGAIDGPVPLFAFTAPTPGSGKSLLPSIAAQIAMGRPASTASLVSDEMEMTKILLSIALSGAPLVVFDDLPDSTLGTSALSRTLTDTSQMMEGRMLGQSRWVRVPARSVFVATANNMQYKNTLARRVVQCTIDPALEAPETRGGWKYPDVLGYVKSQRAVLVVAALTLLRAHAIVGRPAHSESPFGSYEAWDKVVRSALIWAGAADPRAGHDTLHVAADADTEPLRVLVAAWLSALKTTYMSVGSAIDRARNLGVLGQELIRAFEMIDERLRAQQIGQALARWQGRIVDGSCFTSRENAHKKTREWSVVPASAAKLELVT